MSGPRRSVGPVVAYMLTLLGLVLGGIWIWNAIRSTPAPRGAPEARVQLPQATNTPPSDEEISATERQALEDILRRKAADATH